MLSLFLLSFFCSLLENPSGGPDLMNQTAAKAPGSGFIMIRRQYLNFWRDEFTDGTVTNACFTIIVSSQQMFGRYYFSQSRNSWVSYSPLFPSREIYGRNLWVSYFPLPIFRSPPILPARNLWVSYSSCSKKEGHPFFPVEKFMGVLFSVPIFRPPIFRPFSASYSPL